MELHRVFQSARSAIVSRPTLLASQPQRCIIAPTLLQSFSTSRPTSSPPPPASAEAAAPSTSSSSSSSSPQSRELPFSARFGPPSERLRSTLAASRRATGTPIPPRPTVKPNLWTMGAAALDLGRPGGRMGASSVDEIINNTRRESALGQGPAQGLDGFATFREDDFNKKHAMQMAEPRLRPSTGRTVNVAGSIDVARSFTILQRAVQRNRVSADERYQRFHERAGLKRKRLKSERWIRRFKVGFRAACERVEELRRQGW